MPSKKYSDERKLRRQIEMLRAQLKTYDAKAVAPEKKAIAEPAEGKTQDAVEERSTSRKDSYLKRDLLKTGVLTILCFLIIGIIYTFRAQIFLSLKV